MTTSPFGQPEPFDPTTTAMPVVRARSRSSRLLLPIVAGVLLVAVAFGGGFAVANATASKTTTGTGTNGNGDNGGQGFTPGSSFRPRNGASGFGGGASGTVGSVSADQMTITTQAGGSRIVLLTPTTTVTQVSSATKALSDIAGGQTVTVIGTANPDGSVTATQVIIGNVSLFGRGFGGPNDGANGSPVPSNAP